MPAATQYSQRLQAAKHSSGLIEGKLQNVSQLHEDYKTEHFNLATALSEQNRKITALSSQFGAVCRDVQTDFSRLSSRSLQSAAEQSELVKLYVRNSLASLSAASLSMVQAAVVYLAKSHLDECSSVVLQHQKAINAAQLTGKSKVE